MEGNLTNEVIDRMQYLFVEEDKVEEEFVKDFGSRLRLVNGAMLIQDIGNRLNCTLITVAKAMVLYHKMKRNSQLSSSMKSPLGSVACLNLCIKLCEEDVSVDEVVIKSYHVILDLEFRPNPTRPDPPVEEVQQMKKNLYLAECAICRAMSYKLECDTAHMYVYKFLAQLQSLTDASESIIVSISTTITKLLSTYYLCEGCIDFTADEIAFACLQFANLNGGFVNSFVKNFLRKELASVHNKDKISEIVDEFIIVSDVSTLLQGI